VNELQQRYAELMRLYVLSEDEAALAAIAGIGCEIVAADLPIEEIAGLQEGAVLAVVRTCGAGLDEIAARRSSACLAELMIAYSVAYREKSELVARARAHREQHDRRLTALGQLVAGVAHELNNLLQPIRGMAELGLLDTAPSGPVHTYFTTVLDCADQSAAIVRGILSYLRQRAPQPRPMRFATALERSIDFARLGIVPGLRLRVEIEDREAVVVGDETELTQIVVNLVQNASKALQGTGEVSIRLQRTFPPEAWTGTEDRRASIVSLIVIDDGPGMSADVAARAFDPFFTTRAPGEGTGLGLAIVRGIVRAWGGEVTLDSAPNAGTRITIELPVVDAAQ
jgi:signal transduction histidine kinase